ncbi:MAG: sugar ABC transporter ATP-binding protein [bacterium]|nr:sugar ABC transporter ATP-binding protein [bacterium]
MAQELVRMNNITKRYGNVQALDSVNMTVNTGEIIGLVGDNGAGKSTLIKILSGAHKATAGEIHFKDQAVKFENTRDAIVVGIETIYQDSALVEQLSIARNLFLGREPTKKIGFLHKLDMAYMHSESRKLLKQVGISKNINPDTPITALSGGERQSIAIARAMFFEADLIILDEPTNNLGVEETQGVLNFIKTAKETGHSSVFITHNIYHIFQVVDRIVILRHGKKIAEMKKEETTVEEVEKIITGMLEGPAFDSDG